LMLLAGCLSGGEPFNPTWELAAGGDAAPSLDSLVASWSGLDRASREEAAVAEILAGHVPSWLRNVQVLAYDVPLEDRSVRVEVGVLPDYLTVGSDEDYLWMPLSPQAAQRIADATGMLLPTPFLVDAIWRGAPPPGAPPPPLRLPTR
jgi:hypothetical protein